jgi:mannitol-specific phosphotransferase system IIBC component
MKKLMSVLLGMSVALGTVSLFAQNTETKETTKMEKKGKKMKKTKKTEKSTEAPK